jgi:hypothetical protein
VVGLDREQGRQVGVAGQKALGFGAELPRQCNPRGGLGGLRLSDGEESGGDGDGEECAEGAYLAASGALPGSGCGVACVFGVQACLVEVAFGVVQVVGVVGGPAAGEFEFDAGVEGAGVAVVAVPGSGAFAEFAV